MDESESVSDADFADAVGEIANVVGGNIKSLVTNPGALTLARRDARRARHVQGVLPLGDVLWVEGRPVGRRPVGPSNVSAGLGPDEKDGER